MILAGDVGRWHVHGRQATSALTSAHRAAQQTPLAPRTALTTHTRSASGCRGRTPQALPLSSGKDVPMRLSPILWHRIVTLYGPTRQSVRSAPLRKHSVYSASSNSGLHQQGSCGTLTRVAWWVVCTRVCPPPFLRHSPDTNEARGHWLELIHPRELNGHHLVVVVGLSQRVHTGHSKRRAE